MLQWLAASEGQRRLLYFPFELKVGPVPLAEAWSMGAVCMTQERMHVQEWMLPQYNHPISSHTFPIHPHSILIKSYPIAMFRCGIQLFLPVSTRSWCAWVKTCVAGGSRWVSCMVLWWASRSQRRPVTSSSIWSLVTDGLGIFGDFLSTGHMEYQGLRRFIGDPRNMWWWSLSVLDVGVWYSESGMKQLRLHCFGPGMGHDVPW